MAICSLCLNAGNVTAEPAPSSDAAWLSTGGSEATTTIGEFGFGLKTALSNLAAVFEMDTATADSDDARRLTYYESKSIGDGEWEIEPVEKTFGKLKNQSVCGSAEFDPLRRSGRCSSSASSPMRSRRW